MALIGLDVGGSGVKAVAFTDDGTILCSAYREYDMIHPAHGVYEYDPNAIWEATKGVLREAAASCTQPIRGIGVSSFGESMVLLDNEDRVLCNTPMYLDTRGEEYLNELKKKMDETEFRAITGSVMKVNHTTIKLHFMRKDYPDVFEKTARVCFIADFVLYRLGGANVTDITVAETTGGFNMQTGQWQKDLFAWSGFDPDLLPDLVAPGTCVGTISKKMSEELGITPGALLVTGGLDHIPSSVGCGVIEKGQMMNAIGTVDCFCLITDTFDPRVYDGYFQFLPHYTKDCYGGMIANMAGGVLLKWFREHFGKQEKALWKAQGLNFYTEYEKRMAKEPTDLIVLPRFSGYFDRFSDRAGILNMTLSTTNEEIYRAFMEGATYEMYTLLKAYNQPVQSVTVVGGAAQCDTYMQIRSDIFDLPIRTVTCDQPGALGDAIAAGVAAGIYRDTPEGVAQCVHLHHTFEPDPQRHAFYQEQYEKYLKIYAFLETL